MPNVHLTLNGTALEVENGLPLIQTARESDVYIPGLCFHPDLPPAGECGLCLVEVEGESALVHACETVARDGLVVTTESNRIQKARQEKLAGLLSRHPHACLTCAQQEGCPREPCSANVPVEERCCPKFGHCEVQKVAAYVGIPSDTEKWIPTTYPKFADEPILRRDYNLCIGCGRCVRACNDLRAIGALTTREIESGVMIAWAKNQTLLESGCKFCGACVEVCPTGALVDKDIKAGRREDVLVPCRAACPVGIDVPRYVNLVANGQAELAARVVRQKVPFPTVLGYACFHPCEDVCRRGELDQPIAICALKRFAAETDPGPGPAQPKNSPKNSNDKQVAVIGAGPAGLTAAFYLALAGLHAVVYEAMPEPGGMMRYGAPPYRLPREAIDEDLAHITALSSLELKCNMVAPSPKALMSDGYQAVVVATGTWKSKSLSIEGMSLDGVVLGGDFLRDRALGKFRRDRLADRKLVVIGGGNVAIDCARTALRLGVASADIACLETRDTMPAHAEEIADAEAEGVRIHEGWGPKLFIGDGVKVTGVELKACTRVFDRAGHFSPEFDESRTSRLEADVVILAVGLQGDLEFCRDDGELTITEWATIAADADGATSEPGVFAAGDIVTGPTSIVEAIAAGRRAASSVMKYLGNDRGDFPTSEVELPEPDPVFGEDIEFVQRRRVVVPKLDPSERINDLDAVELGYDAEAARREAGRCLRCDMRLRLRESALPPEPWLSLTQENLKQVPECEGVYQLLDRDKKVIAIKGTPAIKADLLEILADPGEARFFIWEEAPMYTQRESELIQQHLQTYRELPSSGRDDLDDLFDA
jgi:NADPH-dependent glutamate synthase beta subunit-like oxidoreductase/Pyruvate/2-oxoacid:ferredoxin oxidoreductase delta subunit